MEETMTTFYILRIYLFVGLIGLAAYVIERNLPDRIKEKLFH